MQGAPRRLTWIPAALAAVLVGAFVVATQVGGTLDLEVYRMGGRYVLTRGDDLYSLVTAGLAFTYSPFAAVLFAPLALAPDRVATLLMFVATVAALVRVAWLLAKVVYARRGMPAANVLPLALSMFVVAICTEPFTSTISYGQVNVVLMWVIVEDCIGVWRQTAGVGTGLAAGVKLIPSIFVALYVVCGEWRRARNALLGLASSVLIGFIVLPESSRQYWGGVAFDPARVGGVAYVGNQSLYGALFRLHLSNRLEWLALAVGVCLTALWAARRFWAADARLEAVCTVACASLLASPIAWSHHWVWILPIGVVLAVPDRAARARRMRVTLLVAWVLLTLSRAIWWLPHGGDVELKFNAIQTVLGDGYAIVGLLTLLWFTLNAPRPQRGCEADSRYDDLQVSRSGT